MSHMMIALVIQAIGGLITGNYLHPAILVAGFYLGREHAQAEYRFMAKFGITREHMPLWAGFDPQVWTLADVLDWFLPLVTVLTVYILSEALMR